VFGVEQMELACLYFLHTLRGVGNKTLWKIKREWGSFKACCQADSAALQCSSLPAPIKSAIVAGRQGAELQTRLERLRAEGIGICTVEDDGYPQLLGSIYEPPYLFYYRGDLDIASQFSLGVVGSRAATTYGKLQSRRFAKELADQGWVVVSGMARGIDTEAHLGALEVHGKTIAVLGSGLEVVYPPENKKIYDLIWKNGLLLSEFLPRAHPEPGNFPVRNRTIAGLCRGVLVVEAKQRSGALITADFALEQGRDVFAIPGPINSPNSAGTNYLIKQGACLVSSIEDILTEYGLINKIDPPLNRQGELGFDLNPEELAVLEGLGHEVLHFDILMGSTALSIGTLCSVLLKLELQGIIRALPGNCYVKI
jgi:DNA processing protein